MNTLKIRGYGPAPEFVPIRRTMEQVRLYHTPLGPEADAAPGWRQMSAAGPRLEAGPAH